MPCTRAHSRLVGLLRLGVLGEDPAGDLRVLLRTGQFLQQGGLLALLRFQEGREIVLGQEHRAGELIESQADQLDDTGLQVLVGSRLLFPGIYII